MNILLSKIKPNPWNPNQMTEQEFKELVEELKHLGKPAKPIILRKKDDFYEIVDGEHNYRALVELKFQELEDGWYEIQDLNDVEAMRQTYKRNLGGTNNPIKLGLMFDRAIKESGKSNRDLAKEWEVSEGTIRNYLLYVEISQLRNDYANLEKLGIEQVRIYNEIAKYAKGVADFWLSCGGHKDALVWYNDMTYSEALSNGHEGIVSDNSIFKEITADGFDRIFHTQKDTVPQGMEKWWINQFKEGIKKAEKLCRLKRKLTQAYTFGLIGEDREGKLKAKEYIDFYFNNINISGGTIPQQFVDSLFKMVIVKNDDNKFKFLLTLDELKECLEVKKVYNEIIVRAKLLIAKKHNIAPSEIKDTYGSLEDEIDELEIKNKAPDYVKNAPISPKLKLAFINYDFEDATDDVKGETFLKLVRMARGGISQSEMDDTWKLKNIIQNQLAIVWRDKEQKDEDERLRKSTKEELITLFVERMGDSIKWTDKEGFIKRMTAFTREELYTFVYLAKKFFDEKQYQEMISRITGKLHEVGI